MNAYRLQWCIMFLTDFWKKIRIYIWCLGIFTFLWVLAPSWQHFGCRSLCQPSPVELYYRLIDLNQDSKVIQGVKFKKRWKFWRFLLIFTYIRFKIVSDRSRKWKTRHSAFNWKKITSARRLQTMLDLKMYPFPFIWLES